MGGDYSRMTFKPARDYNGVFKQQGRVGLEADHNELVEILDRRWRAESIDIMGRCAVPISNPANRTAFEILPEPGSGSAASFTIGRGRMYVDGLQIECRGDDGQVEYDASLGEERGKDPLPYDKQPHFYPNNPLLPDPPCTQNTGLTDLVYVDAWEREVTAIEDPDIREIALGGPDTATRLQTVWQVRVLSNVGLHTCGDDIRAWNDLTMPTTGRLTTSAVAPPASDNPCVLSPTGGYRGLENRLYHVEIQESGELRAPGNATASFKWSRDNGSILTRVEEIPAPDQLKVQRIGRDLILRFKIGDWVEVSDDPTEFALKAGHLARVTDIDEANRTLTIDTPIPASFGFNATKTEWHTRVRRWDGVGDVVTGAIDIEDGVQITFGAAVGDTFKIGDYWVFAARTADGSVEQLVNALPRGVQHHYCRLALIIWNNPLVRLDCRDFWPAEGCCTEIVWPGEDIQAAIDRLPAAGGCVCLKPGLHEIFKPLTIARPNVTLHGETIGAVIRSNLSTRMLTIAGARPGTVDNVMVHDIRFETLAPNSDAIIVTVSVGNAVLRECEIFVDLQANPRAMAMGIVVSGVGATATITMNEISGVVIGVIAVAAQRAEITHNQIEGALLPFRGTTAPIGQYGVFGATAADGFVVEENTLSNFWIGVYIARSSQRSIIARNRIARSGTASMAPQTLFEGSLIPPGPTNTLTFFAIDCAAPESIIAENSMNTINEVQGGVRVTAAAVRVEGNRIVSELPQGWVQPPPVGVFLQTPDDSFNVSECVVVANRLFGPQTGIDVAATRPAAADHLQILDNVYRGVRIPTGVFAYGILAMNAHNSLVAGNAIETCAFGIAIGGTSSVAGNRVQGNRVSSVAIGILASLQQTLAVSDNTINRASLVGIVGGGCVSATYSENRIAGATTGIISTSGATTAIRANSLSDGVSGIIVYRDIDIVIDGNTIENMELSGIATLQIVGSTIRDNRVAWCGYSTGSGGPPLTAAIAQVSTIVSATIESCDVVDTGRSRDGTQLSTQDTYSVIQIGVADAHIRTNRINNALGLNPKSQHAGIFVSFGAQAEITDNVVTGTDARPLINVPGINFIFFNFRFADVICSGNRCVQSVPSVPTGSSNPYAGTASIVLAAERITSIGNHVRATNPNFPSFDTNNAGFVSATGNITSGDWVPAGGPTFVPALLTANHIRI